MRPTIAATPRSRVAAALFASAAIAASTAQALPISDYITVQPWQVCNSSGVACGGQGFVNASGNAFVDATRKIYEQVGLDVLFLPTQTINSSGFNSLDVSNDNLDQFRTLSRTLPGAQHPNSTTVNMYMVNEIALNGNQIYGFGWLGDVASKPGNEGANGIAVSNAVFAANRLDTFAHEISHNLGLDHTTFGVGPANLTNLMQDGPIRTIPTILGNIVPDGLDLDILNAAQITQILASPLLADAGNVNFDTTDNVFNVSFDSGAAGMSLKKLRLDLTTADDGIFFNPTNAAPGGSGSPFQTSFSCVKSDHFYFDPINLPPNQSGLSAADIVSVTGNADGSKVLEITFADGAFAVGDGFCFFIDVRKDSAPDVFATNSKFDGAKVTFEFDTGHSESSIIERVADANVSGFVHVTESRLRTFSTFIGSPDDGAGKVLPEPEAVADLDDFVTAEPGTLALLLSGLVGLAGIRRRRLLANAVLS